MTDETYWTMRPTLAASDGDLWLMSTTNGKRDSCIRSGHTEAQSGSGSWPRGRIVHVSRNGFWRRSGRNRNVHFRQEYLCEFVEREGAAFSQESIDAPFQDFEPMKI